MSGQSRAGLRQGFNNWTKAVYVAVRHPTLDLARGHVKRRLRDHQGKGRPAGIQVDPVRQRQNTDAWDRDPRVLVRIVLRTRRQMASSSTEGETKRDGAWRCRRPKNRKMLSVLSGDLRCQCVPFRPPSRSRPTRVAVSAPSDWRIADSTTFPSKGTLHNLKRS